MSQLAAPALPQPRRFTGPAATLAITIPALAACLVVVAASPHEEVLEPWTGALALCALLANRAAVDVEGSVVLGGAFVPLVLAFTFLGAAPVFAVAALAELGMWAWERYGVAAMLTNLVGVGLPNVGAGVAMAFLDPPWHSVQFYVVVAALASLTILANAIMVTALSSLLHGGSTRALMRGHRRYIPQLAAAVAMSLGTAVIYTTEGEAATLFVLGAIPLFTYMTAQAVAANTRATRIEELAVSRGILMAQALQAEETSRRSLATSLHDGPVQTLLVARQELLTPGSSSAPHALAAIDQTVDQLRSAIFDLHPAVLDRVGLEPALRALVDQQVLPGGVTPHISIAAGVAGQNDRLLYSLVRELVLNVGKHAEATALTVDLDQSESEVQILVRDDGRGSSAGDRDAALRRGHIGLASGRERVSALDGEYAIESSPGHGTCVRITLPRGALEMPASD